MNLLDLLTISPYYVYRTEWVGAATNDNLNFVLRVERIKRKLIKKGIKRNKLVEQ